MRFERHIPSLLLVAVWAVCAPGFAIAQDGGGMRVSFSSVEGCGTPKTRSMLREAIRTRLGQGVELGTGELDRQVRWMSTDAGCTLRISTRGTEAVISLPSDADPGTIRNAASRAVWLLTNAEKLEERPEPLESEKNVEEEVDETREEPPEPPKPKEVESREAQSPDDREEEQQEEAALPPQDQSTGPGEEQRKSGQTTQPDYIEQQLRIGLAPGLALPPSRGPSFSRFAVNLYGHQAGLRGIELGLLANVETDFVDGIQLALGPNVSHGTLRGLSVSMIGNVTLDKARGAQFGYVTNYASALEGVQVSGMVNVVGGRMDGAQLSMVNVVGGRMDGAQLSTINVVAGPVGGAQIGNFNYAGKLERVQIGLFNWAGDVDGLQLGLVNVADDSDLSVGLMNINYGRPVRVTAWGSEMGFLYGGLRHGSRYLQSIVGVGLKPFGDLFVAATAMGIGLHFNLGPADRFYISPDLLYHVMMGIDSSLPFGQQLEFRTKLGWKIADRFAIYGGLSLNMLWTDSAGASVLNVEGPLVFFEESSGTRNYSIWPGFQIGVRL